LLATLTCWGLIAGNATAGCISAAIAEPILLPGGSEHPSGTLTLCVSHTLSPVASLHETFVDGMPVGLLASRRGLSEGSGDGRPFMMFNRDAEGRLRLYGFATPAGDRMLTYQISPLNGSAFRSHRRRGGPEAATIFLAASFGRKDSDGR